MRFMIESLVQESWKCPSDDQAVARHDSFACLPVCWRTTCGPGECRLRTSPMRLDLKHRSLVRRSANESNKFARGIGTCRTRFIEKTVGEMRCKKATPDAAVRPSTLTHCVCITRRPAVRLAVDDLIGRERADLLA